MKTVGTNGFEFVKRLSVRGVEVTPLPWKVMKMKPASRYIESFRLTYDRFQGEDLRIFMNFNLELARTSLSKLEIQACNFYITSLFSTTPA